MRRALDLLAKVEMMLIFVIFSVICVIAFANVLGRYVFNASLAFTGELTTSLAVVLALLGTALGVRQGGHLGFSLLHDYSKGQLRKGLSIFIGVMMCALFVVLIVYGWNMMANQISRNRVTPSLRIPQFLFSMWFPIAGVLGIIHTIEVTLADIKGRKVVDGGGPIA